MPQKWIKSCLLLFVTPTVLFTILFDYSFFTIPFDYSFLTIAFDYCPDFISLVIILLHFNNPFRTTSSLRSFIFSCWNDLCLFIVSLSVNVLNHFLNHLLSHGNIMSTIPYFSAIVLPVSTLYINKTQLKWTLALKSCKDTGNSLYIIHNVDDFNNVTRLLDVEEGTSFWIGGKERRKFFFWNDGNNLKCYKFISDLF